MAQVLNTARAVARPPLLLRGGPPSKAPRPGAPTSGAQHSAAVAECRGGPPAAHLGLRASRAPAQASRVAAHPPGSPVYVCRMCGRSSPVSTGRSSPPSCSAPRPRIRSRPTWAQGHFLLSSATSLGVDFGHGPLGRDTAPPPRHAGVAAHGSFNSPSLPGSDSSRGGSTPPRSPPVKSDYSVRRGALKARIHHV
ncbi:hypothetical protein NDU88_004447 [Pleurodeles waltl]|uniref:Uncharacterized protein n=1 Tax=Pleurodeles waltl TaxID=8319 RepID=A0AAV7M6C8_PLEWA|nr:hypothetical protein NDU88_004447 [Pleurodeles waltl]